MAAATLGLVPTIAVVTLNTSAQAVVLPAVSSTVNSGGFPDWYQDATGTRVEPCFDVNDIHCVVAPSATFVPANPVSFPNNYPDEFFYSVVDADALTTPGCPSAADPLAQNPGKLVIRFALEGAFFNGNPAPGDQMVFGRTRITARGGLCPGTEYTFTTPYGVFKHVANDAGSIVATAGTSDIGCVPTPTVPCNFAAAFASPLLNPGLLRWDSGADPGYLSADSAVPHTITGGIGGVNSVTVATDAGPVAGLSTNLFLVAGKLAGPLQANTAALDMGPAQYGSIDGGITPPAALETPSNTVTLKNIFRENELPRDLTISSVSIAPGPNEGDFAVTSSCPIGTVLTLDDTCGVTVTFTPGAVGRRTATLNVVYTEGANPGLRTPFALPLVGHGVSVGAAAAITLDTDTINFGTARKGTITPFQTVTVSNSGDSPLKITSIEADLTSADYDQFRVGFDQCTSTGPGVFIPASSTCTFAVAFQPTSTGNKTAVYDIFGNIDGDFVALHLLAEGTGGVATLSSTRNALDGFPDWYQDEAGQRVGECLDPTDPLCIVLPDDFYVGGPLEVTGVAPNRTFVNYPSEFFYTVDTSDNIATPGCGNSAPGKAFIRTAVEGAFSGPTGGPVDGEQMVFARTRIVVTSGLCPGQQYTVTYPYGNVTVTADSAGGVRRNAATTDVGCLAGPPTPCDYNLAVQGEIFGEFLKQVNAPAGYLGDPNVLAPVTGAPFLDPKDDVTPANFLRFEGPDGAGGTLSISTDQFTVMGKLVGPIVANPSPVDFGQVEVLSASAPQTVTFTNEGTKPVKTAVTNAASVTGPTAIDFTLSNDTCENVTLAAGAACSVDVTFTPHGSGQRGAKLTLTHDGQNSPTPTNLTGTGGAGAGEPAISVQPLSVDFTDLHVNQSSASESVRASNLGGSAPLLIGAHLNPLAPVTITDSAALGGAIDPNFSVVDQCTDDVPFPAGECVLLVRFTPAAAGAHTAYLHIPNNTSLTSDVVVTLHGRGTNLTPAQAANDASHGFPSYFQDDNGVRLQPCLTSGDQNCVLLGDAGYNPAQPVVFPGNFPLEFFYALADSNIVTITKATGNCGVGGTVQLRLALEGTFTTTTVQNGAQTFFGRWRITGKSLCPNTAYTFDTPWGTIGLASNGTGAIPANQGTIDFTNPLVNGPGLAGGPLSTGFLRWDPQSATAPAGYLGDARTFKPVIGARYVVPGETEPANFFRVRGPGVNDKTDEFLVAGKTAGPVVVNTKSLSFGNQAQGSSGPTQTITYTNLSNDTIGAINVAIVPPGSPFEVVADTCSGQTLAGIDTTCTVQVRLHPGAGEPVGSKTATVQITHDGLRPTASVALTGTVTQPATAEMHVTPPSINFGSVNTGASTTSNVTISSTGTADLVISDYAFGGPNGAEYTVLAGGGTCPLARPITVLMGTSCTMAVRFAPTGSGNRTATFTITSNNAPVNPVQTVALSGTGLTATVAITPTTLTFATKGTSTNVVKLTNTGTANLNLVAPVFSFVQTVTNPVANGQPLKYTATHNCNNVAPGKSCNVSITFNPGAGTANQVYSAVMTIFTNATNGNAGQFVVNLTGTRK